MLPIALATEDAVSEAVGIRIVKEYAPSFEVWLKLGKQGNGWLRENIQKFCDMGRQQAVLLLTDLDRTPCAPVLLNVWTKGRVIPQKFLFRVAVREIESWLLADHVAFKKFLGQKNLRLPDNPDQLLDPKRTLLEFAKESRRDIRDDLLARNGVMASQGLGYNSRLSQFVLNDWNPERAQKRSDSLRRTCERLRELSTHKK
jgi:hypothetical protein